MRFREIWINSVTLRNVSVTCGIGFSVAAVEWWRKRPVAPIFDRATQVENINEYSQLVKRVFGDRFYYAEPWETVLTTVN